MNAVRSERLTIEDKLEWINESTPLLAAKLLADPVSLAKLTGETAVQTAQNNLALCMADPCAYGLAVRDAVTEEAKARAKVQCEYLSDLCTYSLPDWRGISLTECFA